MHAIEVKNLVKRFDGITAVENVSFTVPEGAIFGLIGRNGAGKTTTLRMLMNVYMPDEGEVLVRGASAGHEFRERSGYLPEERGLYKKLKVFETLLFFAELKNAYGKEVEEKAVEYLKKFDLYDRRNSKLEDLSKGNQQKIQFLSTIIHNPDFLVLDEPFSGLDPVNTNILKEIILDLKKQGKVIIFSTHLMDFAERMCDTITMIDKGKVILAGNLQEIKAKFAEGTVKIVCDGDIGYLQDLPYVEKLTTFGNTATVKVTEGGYVQDVLKKMVEKDTRVHSFISNEITLHEIFIALAGDDNDVHVQSGGKNA
ncbi:MAG: ATP-binding cassette domain-containing protein [Ignavibacteria bacterium]|nr:ATP-binding cassette domain-containing protein [Ignavibacteria bacterium]